MTLGNAQKAEKGKNPNIRADDLGERWLRGGRLWQKLINGKVIGLMVKFDS